MKNIIKVFLSDAKRLTTNVVAIVIIMGLGIIPALYAWFNIMSNWDPYGEDATSKMKIAVFSEDKGYTYGDLQVNIGTNVVDGLRENTTMGWVFSETSEEAINGVYNGSYYAAFIIPDDFTEDMLTILTDQIENPTIKYYENSKKNAIATKITSKVKNTIQNSVNTSIVSTLTTVLSKSGELMTGNDADKDGLILNTKSELKKMDETLTTYISVLNTMVLLTESTDDLVGSSQALIPNAETVIDSSQGTVSSFQDTILASAQTADTIAAMVDISLDSINANLENLNNQLALIEARSNYTSFTSTFNTINSLMQSTLETLKSIDGVSSLEEYQKLLSNYEKLCNDFSKFTTDEAATEADIQGLQSTIKTEIKNCRKSIKALKQTFDYEIAPSISNSVYAVESTLIKTQNLLSGLDDSFPEIDRALQSYRDTLSDGTDEISATKTFLEDIKDELGTLINGIETLSCNSQYQQVVQILKTDPAIIASFVSSPISMETESIYEIETYGSAMAPFYTVLALWVGGLIMVALIHVKVKDQVELEGVKQWQKYFGRYLTFFFIGQAQTLITVLGNLFYIKIQCPHPFLFWLASALTSLVFTIFMYSLTVALGNVGQAIAVVVMVIQVAGAGGTFPVEVLPAVYQAVYRYLPFTYCMNALRECVGGMYHMDYVIDLGVLGIYLIVSLVIGLGLRRPFLRLMNMMEESKKKSGIMM